MRTKGLLNVAGKTAFLLTVPRLPGHARFPARLLAATALSAMLLATATAQTLDLPALPDTAEATTRDLAASVAESRDVSENPPAREAVAAAQPELKLDLPELPEAVARFDAPEAPVVIALPELPQPDPSTEFAGIAATSTTGSVASPEMKLDLPELPQVELALAPLRLDLTEDKLVALLQPARQKFNFKPAELQSFAAAYAARDFNAIWLKGEGADLVVSTKAAALREALAGAERSGLDASRLLAVLPEMRSGKVPADKAIETDIGFSLAAFLYARDLRGGRVDPSRLSALTTPALELPEAGDVLMKSATAEPAAIGSALLAYEPQHEGYQRLKGALAKLREALAAPVLTGSVAGIGDAPQAKPSLPPDWLDGPRLAFDKADSRVPMLRQRLGVAPDAGDIYDADLRKAVMRFQRANGLKANGVITPKTRAALENPASAINETERKPDNNAKLTAILANMERWRWLPADLGKRYVFVNVADYDLKVFDGKTKIHETRVIVGRPQTQTPIFSDAMEHVIVNPSWGVPASIIKKEFLPKMAADPDYAARRGYTVVRRGNQISIRQPPGAGNALGYIKFIFPNQHSVYLHDTPNRGLFQAEARAFSHGCVRVYQPFSLAEKLLQPSLGYSEADLKGMIGRGERMIKLKEKIPVHLTYFTVDVNEAGEVVQHKDIYGHDSRMRTALRL